MLHLKIVFILLPLMMLLSACLSGKHHRLPPPEPDLAAIIGFVRPSIVRIESDFAYRVAEANQQEQKIAFSGTGFILDTSGKIATAAHVISLAINTTEIQRMLNSSKMHLVQGSVKLDRVVVKFPESDAIFGNNNAFYGNYVSMPARIAKQDDIIDAAILECDKNPLETARRPMFKIGSLPDPPPSKLASLPLFQIDHPKDGEQIAVSGFPLGIPSLVTNVGWIASPLFIDQKYRRLYLASILINHGNSGGPAYIAKTGKIIGCVVEYRAAPEGNSGLTVIVPIERFNELLASPAK